MHFTYTKYEKNKDKVAEFIGADSINKATFEKIASYVKDTAILKGDGVIQGSTMYIARTAKGYMTVVEGAYGGVTLFGCTNIHTGLKATVEDIAFTVKTKGLISLTPIRQHNNKKDK